MPGIPQSTPWCWWLDRDPRGYRRASPEAITTEWSCSSPFGSPWYSRRCWRPLPSPCRSRRSKGDHSRYQGRGKELTDDRLEIGETASEGMHRDDVPVSGSGQCHEAEVERVRNDGRAVLPGRHPHKWMRHQQRESRVESREGRTDHQIQQQSAHQTVVGHDMAARGVNTMPRCAAPVPPRSASPACLPDGSRIAHRAATPARSRAGQDR